MIDEQTVPGCRRVFDEGVDLSVLEVVAAIAIAVLQHCDGAFKRPIPDCHRDPGSRSLANQLVHLLQTVAGHVLEGQGRHQIR